MGQSRGSTSGSGLQSKRRRRARGFTIIEIMVTGAVSVVLGAGVWTLVRSSYDSQWEIQNQNAAYATCRQVVDTMADQIRGASAVTAAAANDVTFTDANGNSVRYWLSGTSLKQSVNGLPSSGTTLYSTVAGLQITSLSFTYWWPGTGYWTSGTSTSSPANVDEVDFTVNVSQNGFTRQISASAKVREKP